jgi:hypothetical protein
MDLVAHDEMTIETATKAIARLAEHSYAIDTSEEARFTRLYKEDMAPYTIDNYHRPWSREDVELLLKMRRSGADFPKIARRLKRTERGIRSRWAFENLLEREANRNTALPNATEVIDQCCDELLEERPAGFASWYVPARENHPSKVESSPPLEQKKEMLD